MSFHSNGMNDLPARFGAVPIPQTVTNSCNRLYVLCESDAHIDFSFSLMNRPQRLHRGAQLHF